MNFNTHIFRKGGGGGVIWCEEGSLKIGTLGVKSATVLSDESLGSRRCIECLGNK